MSPHIPCRYPLTIAGAGALTLGLLGVGYAATGNAAEPSTKAPIMLAAATDGALGTWSALGTGTNMFINTLDYDRDNDALYAGGAFSQAGGVADTAYIARWSDDTWSALGTGMNEYVEQLDFIDDETGVIAAGAFTSAGGVSGTNRIARFASGAWSAFGSGANDEAKAIASDGEGSIYFGGDFKQVAGTDSIFSVNQVAAWSAGNWSPLSTGLGMSVNALTFYNEKLYAGGSFIGDDSTTYRSYLARWSGSAWTEVEGDVNGSVETLATGNESLYAGGNFTRIDGMADTRIARWSAEEDEWSRLGKGVNGSVYSIIVDSDRNLVYASGIFTTAGDNTATNVAVWDGNIEEWIALQGIDGEGVDSRAMALSFGEMENSAIYVGGAMTSAGGLPVNSVAKWTWDAPAGDNEVKQAASAGFAITGEGFIGVDNVQIGTKYVDFNWDTSTSITITDPELADGTYPIKVEAVGGVGNVGTLTINSTPEPTPTPIPVPTAPSAPTDATATGVESGAQVSWTPPSTPGTFPITTYQVNGSPSGSCLVSAPTTNCEITGLTDGEAYTFTVRALTGAGWSASSTPSNILVPKASEASSITITGTRGDVRGRPGVKVSGSSTGLPEGTIVRPWSRLPGQPGYSQGVAQIAVQQDGSFTWQRRVGKKIYVSIRTADNALVSNRIIIRK